MIKESVQNILRELPEGVELVGAAKTRTVEEILEAVDAGIRIIGENYVQEAQKVFAVIGNKVKWHFIGHLQKNKVKKAVPIFDMIETVDSFALAQEIDHRCQQIDKVMSVLVEVNSGQEPQKFGLLPENVESLLGSMVELSNIKVMGLMTMGPFTGDPEDARPYFIETKKAFERMKSLDLANVQMKYLSMGMSNSYQVALQEGANMVRVGTKIFGVRD